MKTSVTRVCAWLLFVGSMSWAQEHPELGRLEDYEVSEELWVGTVSSEVSVDPEFAVETNAPGDLVWKVDDGQIVEKDQVIATTGAERLALAERDLQNQRSKYQLNLQDLEVTGLEKERALRMGVRELEERLAKMSLTDTEKQVLGVEFEQRLKRERGELKTELLALRKRMEGDYLAEFSKSERTALDLEMEKAEVDFRDMQKNAELTAPVAGRLKIEHREAIRRNTRVAAIIKDGVAEVKVEMVGVGLRDVPGQQVAIDVVADDGKLYRGNFNRESEQRSFDANARIFFFELVGRNAGVELPTNLKGERMVKIYRKLGEPLRVLPKNRFLFQFPAEIQSEGWATFISKRWPGVKVVQVGPRSLAVKKAP